MSCSRIVLLAGILAAPPLAAATTIQVGPTRTYTTVQAGYNAASSGDIIEIDSGTYYGSAAWVSIYKSDLTFRGVGPTRPILDALHGATASKGIFVGNANNLTVENLEFANAWITNTFGANAAGIRFDAANLTVRNCYIHDCQDGILAGGNASSSIFVEYTEFDHNGEDDPSLTQGFGYTHNMYIGHIGTFTLQHCYSHDAYEGHIVKTRASTNYILYNLLSSGANTGSRELQIANGGTAYVIGNVIQQGPNSHNSQIITYGDETNIGGANPNPYLYLINNTVINQRSNGATFITVSTPTNATVVQNNIFQGFGYETFISGAYPTATLTSNWITTNAGLADINAHDYNLTTASTGAINTGTDPGTAVTGYSLTPIYQYVPEAAAEARPVLGTIDIGAYEYTPGFNTAPSVDAGPDQTITLPAPASLSGTATDDGLPNPPSALTYTWSQVSGPALVSFDHANAQATTVSFTTAGVYVLQLTADDSELTGSDTVTITVQSPPAVQIDAAPPFAYENQTVSLHATATDPDGDALTYSWTQTAGRPVTFSDSQSATAVFTLPIVTSQAEGAMAFSVTVSDGHGGTAADTASFQAYMAGDATHDNLTDVADLQALAAAWASTGQPPADANWNPWADANGDGYVNVGDLQILINNWNRTLP